MLFALLIALYTPPYSVLLRLSGRHYCLSLLEEAPRVMDGPRGSPAASLTTIAINLPPIPSLCGGGGGGGEEEARAFCGLLNGGGGGPGAAARK